MYNNRKKFFMSPDKSSVEKIETPVVEAVDAAKISAPEVIEEIKPVVAEPAPEPAPAPVAAPAPEPVAPAPAPAPQPAPAPSRKAIPTIF
jgi:hypothetical protein